MTARALVTVLISASVLASSAASRPVDHRPQSGGSANPPASTISDAYRAAYNLDHDDAVALARRAVTNDPDGSAAHRALASIVWLNILFRRGAVSIDHYLGGLTRSQLSVPKPPADLDAEFKRELARAIELADARLKQNPRDLQARYDIGAAFGVQASYTASVEGSVGSAFRSAKRAYDAQEEVLQRDPKRSDAGVVVGVYRYIVSTLAIPSRMVAYLAGFGGGKEKGISLLEAAAHHPETRVDAKSALMLIFSREGRHDEVVRLARELSAEYPRNRLFILEEGAAAIRAGRAIEAEAALTRGLAAFERDTRPKVPGERALWFYKRGLARVNLNRLVQADVDLREALKADPTGWVRGRLHTELGKIADLGGRRPEALAFYRTAKATCESNADPLGAAEANRWLRRPFSLGVK